MRPIDADALIVELQKDEERFDKEAEDCRKNARNYTDCYMQAMSSRADGIRDAIIEVYDAPTIDVVSVVRCKECKHAHMTYEGLCKHCDAWKDDDGICLELYVSGDYYCADGERKESE